MLKFVLSAVGKIDSDENIVREIEDGELLSDAVDSVLNELKIPKESRENFKAVVNGLHVDKELWPLTKLKKSDIVVVHPVLRGDNPLGNALRIIAIAVVAFYLTPVFAFGAAVGTVGYAAASVAATVIASVAVNGLFPPPVPGGLKGQGASYSGSQMYTLSGQSNVVRKFDTVPKVYGTHRIFPVVAANPYVELEADQDSGALVQFLYSIYDLGLGPMEVRDFKIGDTPISEFEDVTLRLVDPNRPATDEGDWDENLFNSFTLYKDRVVTENLAIVLNSNQTSAGALEENYRAIRNVASNIDNKDVEITLSLVCPQGLYAYNSTGAIGTRSIEMDIEFAEVGTEDWIPYNDLNYVAGVRKAGGDSAYSNGINVDAPPLGSTYSTYQQISSVTSNPSSGTSYTVTTTWGYKKGLFFRLESGIAVGDDIFFNNTYIGRVQSESSVGGGFSSYTIGLKSVSSLAVFQKVEVYRLSGGSWVLDPGDTTVTSLGTFNKRKEILKKFKISRATTQQVYSTVKFSPLDRTKEYKVRITRTSSYSSSTSQIQDAMTFAGLTTRFDTSPIVTDKRHTFVEVRIKATNQLNGQIQNLSAVVTSVLDVWNGTSWVKAATNNPAWVYADLLTGTVNKKAIAKTRLDTLSIKEWADYCDEIPPSPPGRTYAMKRFESNFILDFETTVQQLIGQVTSAAQASLNIIDGKYGVLIDKQRTVPVQIFTPRNSKNFSASKTYNERPDALKIKYIDPVSDWKVQDAIVYDDGKNESNSVNFEEVSSFGVTNYEQAWRFGRYLIAQARLRQERISLEVDFEYLVCSRGDYVQITQDVMKVGGSPARVKSVVGNRITIDDGLETDNLLSYVIVFRSVAGIYTKPITVVNSDTFDIIGTPLPNVGDLCIIGEAGTVVYDCIVQSINPSNDLSATLLLVEKADAIYTAESSGTLPDYNPSFSETSDSDFEAPGEVVSLLVADNSYICNGNDIRYYITLDWEPPSNASVDIYEIYADSGSGLNLVTTTKDSLYEYTVDRNKVGVEHRFKVLAVSATGKKKNLGEVGEVTALPLVKIAKPSNVTSVHIDITNEVLQLVWPAISDCDCAGYRVRYSPNVNDTWEGSVPLLAVDRNTTLASTQARTGIYHIKAFDTTGNESATEASALTTIPELFDLNIIDTTSDFPALTGAKDRVKALGGELYLQNTVFGGVETQEFYSNGYYYYQNLLDLGDIYTVRLQSQIRAEGFTLEDSMANWITLASVLSLANSQSGDWDVKTEYRVTDQFNTISEWVTLDSIATLNEGNSEIFTPWREFVMGDATGRIFQFRLKLISNKVSVTPRVFDGTIRADMPDRVDRYDNITVPSTGVYSLTYTPAFKGPGTSPNIQISISDAASGDYWTISNRDLEGFDIAVFDKDNNQVERIIDVAVSGYGRRFTAII